MTENAQDPGPVLEVAGLVEDPQAYRLADLERLEDQEPGSSTRLAYLAAILRKARPHPAATHMTAHSADGSYSASIPLDALGLGEIHAEGVKSDPQLRLRVPEGKTLCWNVKGLGLLRLTAGPEPDSLPEVLTH